MSDNKLEEVPQDSSRISVQKESELEYWTERLGVNAEMLKAAVNAVGPSSLAVQEHLAGNRERQNGSAPQSNRHGA